MLSHIELCGMLKPKGLYDLVRPRLDAFAPEMCGVSKAVKKVCASRAMRQDIFGFNATALQYTLKNMLSNAAVAFWRFHTTVA